MKWLVGGKYFIAVIGLGENRESDHHRCRKNLSNMSIFFFLFEKLLQTFSTQIEKTVTSLLCPVDDKNACQQTLHIIYFLY